MSDLLFPLYQRRYPQGLQLTKRAALDAKRDLLDMALEGAVDKIPVNVGATSSAVDLLVTYCVELSSIAAELGSTNGKVHQWAVDETIRFCEHKFSPPFLHVTGSMRDIAVWGGGWRDSFREAVALADGAPGGSLTGEPAESRISKSQHAPTVTVANGTSRSDRRAQVNAFVLRCRQETAVKALRKHIWLAAGHKNARQFQFWQASDPKATAEDERNFRRILAMNPSDFVVLLKRKSII